MRGGGGGRRRRAVAVEESAAGARLVVGRRRHGRRGRGRLVPVEEGVVLARRRGRVVHGNHLGRGLASGTKEGHRVMCSLFVWLYGLVVVVGLRSSL